MRETDLTGADLRRCDLSEADLRRTLLADAHLDGAILTGARIHGLDLGGGFPDGLIVEWADASSSGDGSRLLDIRQITRMMGGDAAPRKGARRYFGAGDVLRNAELDFDDAATIHVDSQFEHCAIRLSPEAELVLGERGMMEDCRIEGGRLTIHGRFVEGDRPGLRHPRQVVVSSSGVLAATVVQPEQPTRFAFESGCRLRIEIQRPKEAGE